MAYRTDYHCGEARYTKNMMAIRCPSDDGYKSRAAWMLESVAPRSIRWSKREKAYIVSRRVAERFEAKMRELAAEVTECATF